MRRQEPLSPPSFLELRTSCERYRSIDDPTYRVATLFIERFWGKVRDVAEGIVVLLLVWNKAFYNRYGTPDAGLLAGILEQNSLLLQEWRHRTILDYKPASDSQTITSLFNSLLDGLSTRGRKTPVGVAKALHLLAPHFLPPWDGRIARAYECAWPDSDGAARTYLKFIEAIQKTCQHVITDYAGRTQSGAESTITEIIIECCPDDPRKSLVKLIDEYNFMKVVEPTLRITKKH